MDVKEKSEKSYEENIEKHKMEKYGDVFSGQQEHWDKVYSEKIDMFGIEPSYPACKAVDLFKKEGKFKVLELGGGQGRDTFYFATQGLQVEVVDYSKEGLRLINDKSRDSGMLQSIKTLQHNLKNALPFEDASFDCCYSHMLYCMALTKTELKFLSNEIKRVLKKGGFNVYTARNINDPHYMTGKYHGENIWERGGFAVHFFCRETVGELSEGYDIIDITEFEEGDLPRKLFLVILKKT